MSKSIDNATINDFSPSYDSKSRAAYLRAARSFLNVAQKCNVEDEHTKIGEFAGLVKMDASILTRPANSPILVCSSSTLHFCATFKNERAALK